MKEYNPKIAEHKKKAVNEMIELIKKHRMTGIVNMENLPAPQLQKLRSKLRDTVHIVMTKKSIMRIALENVKSEKKGIEALSNYLEGMPAFVFTEQNPFKVSSIFQKNKSPAPAKPNQTAPFDILIPAGPTTFAPGPIISELGMIGLKTGVEGGKVVIKKDSIVARKGERVKPKVADVLARLSIYPMEVGLELVAAYDEGRVYGKDTLSVTQEEYLIRIVEASYEAMALALEICYMTKETINQLVIKAFVSAKALAESQKIPAEKFEEKEVEEERIEEKEGLEKREGEEKKTEAKERVKEEEKEQVEEEHELKKEEKPEVKEEEKEEREEQKEREEKEGLEEKKEKEEWEEKEEKMEIKELKKEPKIGEVEEPKFKKEIKQPKPQEEPQKKEKILKKPRMVADAVSQEKASELLEQLKETGTLRKRVETRVERRDVKDVDLSKEKIEELAKELRRKGTLRKKGGK